MIPVLKIAIKWQYLMAALFLPSFIFSQSLSNTSTINITKTWSQEPSGYTYPLDIYVPEGSVPNGGFPVCIALHGGGKVGDVAEWSDILSNHIIVAPSGYNESWNIAEETSEAPDVEMVSDLIDSLQAFSNVDPDKIRILGTSLGAALANRVFIENKDTGVDIVCAVVAHLTEASYHNNNFYLPSGVTGDNGTGVPIFDGYDELTSPIVGRKYLNISNTNDDLIPYTGGLSSVGVTFLDAQEAAYILAKSQGYTGLQVMDSTQLGGGNAYEFEYLSGQVVHLQGNAGHAANTTQITYIQNFFNGVGASEPETETETDTTTVIDADNDGLEVSVDCDDNDADVGAKRSPGFPCDDGSIFTNFDQIQSDSCTCLGVLPCSDEGGDEDRDGVCAEEDCDDTNRFIGRRQPPGTSCNDGDSNTENDQIQEDGCECRGVIVDLDICRPPMEASVVAGTGNRVTVEWEERPNASNYTFQIRLKGMNNWLVTTFSQHNMVNVRGFFRTYEYRIRANCMDDSESEYSPIYEFTLPFSNIGMLPSISRNHTPLQEIVIEDTALLYPNPANNRLSLDYIPFSEEAIFIVYDRIGRQIFSQSLPDDIMESYLFDISSFHSGVYFGAIFEQGELQFSQQFYKQ